MLNNSFVLGVFNSIPFDTSVLIGIILGIIIFIIIPAILDKKKKRNKKDDNTSNSPRSKVFY